MAEKHVLADLQVVGEKGRARVVAQARPVAFKAAAYVGTGQADRTGMADPGGRELAVEVHASADLQAVAA